MDNKGLVSVIVASYNHARYITECLDSLLKQSYRNWELIVCDDNSKDDSVAVFDRWLQRNSVKAKKVFHSENTGFCKILNECIALCEGEYVKIIAADDLMGSNLLEEAVLAFERQDDLTGVFYSNAAIIDDTSSLINKNVLENSGRTPSGWVQDILLEGNFVPALTVVMKRRVLESVGEFDTSLIAEDYDYWLRASQFYKFVYDPSILAYYRVHGGNISTNYDCEGEVRQVIIKHDKLLAQKDKINIFFKERYFQRNLSPKLKSIYFSYIGRDKFMTWCIKWHIPYKVYRIFNYLGV